MSCNYTPHVVFVSYDGRYPNLCSGILTLKIDGEVVKFGYPWANKDKDKEIFPPFWFSGGRILVDDEDIIKGKWIIDEKNLPEKYQKYAEEIEKVFNSNVPSGCCGGCI